MNKPSSPWQLVRHLWVSRFRQNPAGTLIGSVVLVGGVGLLLFFGFFVVLAFAVLGGLMLLVRTLFGAPQRRGSGLSSPSGSKSTSQSSGTQGGALEGEFSVVSDDKQKPDA